MQVELETRREETRAIYTSVLTRFIWQPRLRSFIDAIRTPFMAARLVSAVQQHQLFPPSLVVGLPRETAARSTPQRTRTRSLHLMSLRRRSIGCVSIVKRSKTNNNQHKDHWIYRKSNMPKFSPQTHAQVALAPLLRYTLMLQIPLAPPHWSLQQVNSWSLVSSLTQALLLVLLASMTRFANSWLMHRKRWHASWMPIVLAHCQLRRC
jgi:hypothetical protein